VSEQGAWLHVRAAGRDLLLSTLDLREVVAVAPVSPLPGRPWGIQGVVIYEGEFLPVLAWEDLPGCGGPSAPSVAMAVLRPRLGLPLERIIGTVEFPPAAWREADEKDPAVGWQGGACQIGDLMIPLVDSDRLIALLRRFRGDR
jgi:chemotaxis signal transduction protein